MLRKDYQDQFEGSGIKKRVPTFQNPFQTILENLYLPDEDFKRLSGLI